MPFPPSVVHKHVAVYTFSNTQGGGVPSSRLCQHATFVLTHDYAYGDGGFPAWGIPPRASLTFEIELLSAK